jgi:hypothetical protein
MPSHPSPLLPLLLLVFVACTEFVDKAPDSAALCVRTCETAGVAMCEADGARRTCVDQGEMTSDGQPCLSWEAATPCGDGLSCQGAGLCSAVGCTAESVGICDGQAGIRPCVLQSDGSLALGPATSCPTGSACTGGACTDVVVEGCPPDALPRCGVGGVESCTVVDGAPAWAPGAPCGPGQTCRGAGVCGSDACDDGAVRCEGDGRAVCQMAPNGFRDWSAAVGCPDGDVCRLGVCGHDQCAAGGLVGCDVAGAVQTCVATADGFLAWSEPSGCSGEDVCRQGGGCGVDGCPAAGVVNCDGELIRTCELQGVFLAWSESAACDAGVCVTGATGASCVPHECPGPFAPKCHDLTHAAICSKGADGVLRWGEPITCPGPLSVCRAQGVCGVDECPVAGARECLSEAESRECLLGDGDLFTQWGPTTTCETGLTCRLGVCGVDTCQFGDFICSDAGLSGCALQSTGFFVMTGFLPCPATEMDCGTGKCLFEKSFSPVSDLVAPSGVAGLDVAALPSGGFALAWVDAQSGALLLGRFDALGLATAAPDVVSTSAVGATPELAAGVPGAVGSDVLVVWHDEAEAAVRVRWMREVGASDASFVLPTSAPLAAAPRPTVVVTTDGATALRVETGAADSVWASPLTDSGVAYNLQIASPEGPLLGLAATPWPTGGHAAVWSYVSPTLGNLVEARYVNKEAGVVSSPISVPWPTTPGALAVTAIASGLLVAGELADGGLGSFVLPLGGEAPASAVVPHGAGLAPRWVPGEQPALVFAGPSLAGQDVYLLPFGADGQPSSSPLQVSDQLPAGSASGARAVRITSGDIVVAYRVGATLRARFVRNLP